MMNEQLKQKREGAERGLECRKCGCRHFRVINTIPLPGGRIKRRRICRHCGKKTVTYERQA